MSDPGLLQKLPDIPALLHEGGEQPAAADRRISETLENPGHRQDICVLIADQDWGDGLQAARLLRLRAHHR